MDTRQETRKDSSVRPLAVVTGASSGIGYELAKVFAKNGFNLLVVAEDASIVEAGTAFKSFGAEVETVQADLASYQGVETVYAKIKSMNQPIDAVALNAGVGVGGAFAETNLKDEINLIQLNIVSLVHLTKRVLPDLIRQGHGRLLFTSSLAATMPGPYYAVYAASKSFVQSFAEAIRNEVKEQGITVTALQPGATETNFFERAHMQDTKAGTSKKDDPAVVAQDGFEALMAGKDHVIAGSFMNTVQAKVANIATAPQGAAMHASQVKPGSGSTQSKH